jgi:hypothetical protein
MADVNLGKMGMYGKGFGRFHVLPCVQAHLEGLLVCMPKLVDMRLKSILLGAC